MICGFAGMHLGALPCAIRKSPTLGTSPTILAFLVPKLGIKPWHSHFADGFKLFAGAWAEFSGYRLHSTFPHLRFSYLPISALDYFAAEYPRVELLAFVIIRVHFSLQTKQSVRTDTVSVRAPTIEVLE
jgi:hypothetical protein